MTARASHFLLVLAAFLTGLAIFLGVFLYATGNLGRGTAPGGSAIGGPFNLIDQDGKPITDQDMQGPAVPGVLRLHPLPGHLPDGAVRGV